MATMTSTKATVEDPTPRRRDDLVERALPDELILYDVDKDQVFLLNQTSAAIWDLCDGMRSLAGIADEVSQHFSVARETALSDVESTLQRFQAEGLLARCA